MILVVRRFLSIALISFISSVILFGSLTLLALAQTPSPLKIDIVPQAQPAVAGQPFTYTVVVTNDGQTPVAQPVIFTEIPTGTTFIAIHLPDDWLVGNLRIGETGFLAWNSDNPITPGEVVTFTLAVTVLPEMANRSLVNEPVTMMSEADREFFVTAYPITVPVLAALPTPTSTPIPTVTNTPDPLPTASATQTTQPEATALPLMTPTPAPASVTDTTPPSTASTPTPISLPSTPATPSSTRIPAGTVVITVLILAGIVIGLIWFFQRR